MKISPITPASVQKPQPLTPHPGGPPPASAEPDPSPDDRSGRELIDLLKRRSSLLDLSDPLIITTGLALKPGQTLGDLKAIGSSLVAGDLGEAVGGIGELVDTAYRPEGALGVAYRGGLALRAGVDGVIGAIEIREGIKQKDLYLGLMGGADIVGAASTASIAAGAPIAGLALSSVSSAAKVGMVLFRGESYSRIQKMDTLFDAAGAVVSTTLRTGLATVPALVLNAVIGPLQLVYMNHSGFRERVDGAIDWVIDRIRPKTGEAPLPGAPATLTVETA